VQGHELSVGGRRQAGARPGATVIVSWFHNQPDRVAGRLEIPSGQRLLFTVTDGLGIREAAEGDAVGSIDAASNCWSMSNFTATTTFAIENAEGGAELIKVTPRRLTAVVPFEISRVLIPSEGGVAELNVFGAPPAFLDTAASERDGGDGTRRLNERSKYFLVLVALCEPRLRLSSMAAVPSVREVVDRLKPLPCFENVNRSSVNYHIDYLRENKLELNEWAMSAHGGRMHSKREALVSYALRYDLVREEHLGLLPPRPRQHSA
jgi:hypothetical protein